MISGNGLDRVFCMSGSASETEWLHHMCKATGLVEGSHHGRVDFRLNGKIVVNIEGDGTITVKLPLDEQQAILHENPEGVSLPNGWGHHGWTTLQLDHFDRTVIGELIDTATRLVTNGKKRSR
jgi:hypothetical protein